jgi:hypothetical protein
MAKKRFSVGKGRGKPGGMGRGASGTYGRKGTERAVSRGGGNRKGGLPSHQVKSAHNRHKMNNQKVISAMRKS